MESLLEHTTNPHLQTQIHETSTLQTMSDCSSPASHHSSSYSIFSGAQSPETHLTSPSLSREGSPKFASAYEYTANTTLLPDSDYYSSFFPDTSSSYPLETLFPDDQSFFEFASAPLIPLDYFPEDSTALFEDPNFDLNFFPFDPASSEFPAFDLPEPEPQQAISSFWKATTPPDSITTPANSGYPPASAFYGPLPGTFSDPPKPDFTAMDYEYEPWYSADGRVVEFSGSVALHYLAGVGM